MYACVCACVCEESDLVNPLNVIRWCDVCVVCVCVRVYACMCACVCVRVGSVMSVGSVRCE